MSDDVEKQARELADHCRYCGMPDYRPECRADYEKHRRAIAAVLREKDDEIDRLNAELEARIVL